MNISSQKVSELIVKLLLKIPNKYDYVLGILNGGINISVPIAKHLGIPHKTIKISFYDDKAMDYNGYKYQPNGLIVDDLVDNGKTLNYFYDNFGYLDSAVLYWNIESVVKPTYYAEIKPKGWIVFPWEK